MLCKLLVLREARSEIPRTRKTRGHLPRDTVFETTGAAEDKGKSRR
jgi:hypothetical protein